MMIGEAVRKERQRQDFTEDYFASLCLMTSDDLKKIEAGKEMPTMVDIVIMSNILQISFGHLLNGEIRPQDGSIEAEMLLSDIRQLGSDIRQLARHKEMILQKAESKQTTERMTESRIGQETKTYEHERSERAEVRETAPVPVGTRFHADERETMPMFTVDMIRDPGLTEGQEPHYRLDQDEDGIHVFDTAKYDPETGEYSEIARMTSDGNVTYYEETTARERQEISEEMNREQKKVPKAGH